MKRIDGTAKDYFAFKVDLPPVSERPNPDTVAGLERWIMHLPGQSPVWSHYVLMTCSLADFPGVKPAFKKYPEATHEIHIFAVDPATPKETIDKGGVKLLIPCNYSYQCTTTDANLSKLAEHLVTEFVNGNLPAEPVGITFTDVSHGAAPDRGVTAREWLSSIADSFLAKLETEA